MRRSRSCSADARLAAKQEVAEPDGSPAVKEREHDVRPADPLGGPKAMAMRYPYKRHPVHRNHLRGREDGAEHRVGLRLDEGMNGAEVAAERLVVHGGGKKPVDCGRVRLRSERDTVQVERPVRRCAESA